MTLVSVLVRASLVASILIVGVTSLAGQQGPDCGANEEVVSSGEFGTVSVSYQTVSPDGSLPVVQYPTGELVDLEYALKRGLGRPHLRTMVPFVEGSVPALTISTNDPDRLASESRGIFAALGFYPLPEAHETSSGTSDQASASFFDDLLFLYGGPLPVVVMRALGDTGHYEYLGFSPGMPGEVVRGFLGDRPVFWFQEDVDAASSRARIPMPDSAILVLWDAAGRLAFKVRYSALEWREETLDITGNMSTIQATCATGSSAVMCWTRSAVCQLSLLDPVSWEPAVLQTRISIRYSRDLLQVERVHLSLDTPADAGGGYLTCEDFHTVQDILDFSQFGICGSNIDGVAESRCLGSPEGYLGQSREVSRRFWLELRELLQTGKGDFAIAGDARLMTALESLGPDSDQASEAGIPVPLGLGRLDAILMIKAIRTEPTPVKLPGSSSR